MKTGIVTVEYREARDLLDHIILAAPKHEDGISVAVVDIYGLLLCQATLPGVTQMSVDAARRKALTVIRLGRDTVTLCHEEKPQDRDFPEPTPIWVPTNSSWSKDDIREAHAADPDFCAWAGGVQVISPADGSMIGAIGVSGLSELEDHALASLRPSGWSA